MKRSIVCTSATSADEDCQHDAKTGQPLPAHTAEEEGKPKRNRGQRVTEVVDQIREQRNAERARVDERLRDSGDGKDRQAPRHRADPGTGAENRAIDEAMRMVVRVFVLLVVVGMYRGGGLDE
jgi:type IV secretory pathway VirB10-like protein